MGYKLSLLTKHSSNHMKTKFASRKQTICMKHLQQASETLKDESHFSAGGAAFAPLKIAERKDTLQSIELHPNSFTLTIIKTVTEY